MVRRGSAAASFSEVMGSPPLGVSVEEFQSRRKEKAVRKKKAAKRAMGVWMK